MSTSNYIPKVGDRVRATSGKSVLVGEVVLVEFYGTDFYVEIRISSADTWGFASKDGWQFEQIVEVPTKFGAVIRRADGGVFVRRARTHYTVIMPWRGLEKGGEATTTEEATAGGFTVLFEGVDE